AISTELGVVQSVSRVIYNRYVSGELSPQAARFISRTLKPAQESFSKAISKAKFSGRTYFDSHVPVDDLLGKSHGRVRFAKTSLAEMLLKFGFDTSLARWGEPEREVTRRLAPFFEFHAAKSSLPINQKMRRRLHWLVSEPTENAYFS